MVFIGGFVAWAGDHIGRQLGKKRLKLMRLRPKHTAALGTFLAGMFATLATIITLFALSEPVRAWIVEGNRAKAELAKVQEQLGSANERLASARKQVDDMRAQLEGTGSQLADVQKKYGEEQGKLSSARKEVASLQSQTKSLAAQAAEFRNEAAELRKLTEELRKKGTELEDLVAKRQADKDRLEKDNTALQKNNLELQNANSSLTRELEKLSQVEGQLKADIESLEKSLETTSLNYEESRRELAATKSQLEQAKEDIKLAEDNLNATRNATANLARIAGNARTNNLIYHRDDELARIVLRESANLVETRTILSALLKRAKDDSKLRGGAITNDGEYAGLLGAPEADQLEKFAQELVGQPEQQLIIASTVFNAFTGEFVPIKLGRIPNRVIYREGDVIYNVQVDGRKTENEIATRIIDEIANGLTKKAIADGMVPAFGRERALGEITNEQILDMVSAIKDLGRTIRLQLLAARDTRAGDPIDIVFRLRP